METNPGCIYALQGRGWTLPILVKDAEPGFVRITLGAGVPLPKKFLATGKAFLARFGREENGAWTIRTDVLESVAVAMADSDPEDCIDWSGGSYRARASAVGIQLDPFIESFCKHGVIHDPATASLVWASLCNFMLHWLLNEQKPIDFGWGQLAALPYRANWKELLFAHEWEHVRRKPNASYRKHVGWIRKNVGTGWLGKLRDKMVTFFGPQMTACGRGTGIVYWSLDVRPKKAFHKVAVAVEKARLARRGKDYWAGVVDAMKRSFPYALNAYIDFVRAVCRPAAELDPGVICERLAHISIRRFCWPWGRPARDWPYFRWASAYLYDNKRARNGVTLDPAQSEAYVSVVPAVRPPVEVVRERKPLGRPKGPKLGQPA